MPMTEFTFSYPRYAHSNTQLFTLAAILVQPKIAKIRRRLRQTGSSLVALSTLRVQWLNGFCSNHRVLEIATISHSTLMRLSNDKWNSMFDFCFISADSRIGLTVFESIVTNFSSAHDRTI